MNIQITISPLMRGGNASFVSPEHSLKEEKLTLKTDITEALTQETFETLIGERVNLKLPYLLALATSTLTGGQRQLRVYDGGAFSRGNITKDPVTRAAITGVAYYFLLNKRVPQGEGKQPVAFYVGGSSLAPQIQKIERVVAAPDGISCFFASLDVKALPTGAATINTLFHCLTKYSAKAGYKLGMFNLAVQYEQKPTKHAKALHWCEKAVEAGVVEAMYNLGYWHLRGGLGLQVNEANTQRGKELLEQAARLGDLHVARLLTNQSNCSVA